MKKITFFLTKEIKTIVFYFLGFYTCFLALSADFFNIEGLTMEKMSGDISNNFSDFSHDRYLV